jgi:hypothetical protein
LKDGPEFVSAGLASYICFNHHYIHFSVGAMLEYPLAPKHWRKFLDLLEQQVEVPPGEGQPGNALTASLARLDHVTKACWPAGQTNGLGKKVRQISADQNSSVIRVLSLVE